MYKATPRKTLEDLHKVLGPEFVKQGQVLRELEEEIIMTLKEKEIMNEEIRPIHKFNNGRGAMLCNNCRTIISTGPPTEELFCEKCKGERIVQAYYEQMEKEVHFNRGNLNK
jgi:hypothetical protein